MCFGEFDHCAELGSECVAGNEVSGLHRKPAFAVDVDFGHRVPRRIGSRCAAFAFGLAHVCGSWSVKLMPYYYLNRLVPQARRVEGVYDESLVSGH